MSHFPPPTDPDSYLGEADHRLVQSILIALFCCQPLGIVAIVFSAMTMGANNTRDYASAHRHARMAATFGNWGFGLGLGAILIYMMCVCAGVLAGGA